MADLFDRFTRNVLSFLTLCGVALLICSGTAILLTVGVAFGLALSVVFAFLWTFDALLRAVSRS